MFIDVKGVMELSKFNLSDLSEFTSKSRLQTLFKCSRPTIYEYHDILLNLSDYELDFPPKPDGTRNTGAGLTRYQCWAMFTLMVYCRRVLISDVKPVFLQGTDIKFLSKFSKLNFDQLNPNYGGVVNCEYQELCSAS